MCVGRYAAKVMRNERSEMEHNWSEMPANGTQHICIPSGCDFATKKKFDVVAFRWNASYWYTYCRHFASVMLHIASLISHNLRCIPAYTHLIPTGFFQSSLNNHRDNFYIFFYAPTPSAPQKASLPKNRQICTVKMQFSPKAAFF